MQGLISGLSQRQAYKKAYTCKSSKDESIDVLASKLFKQDKVRLRYNELFTAALEQSTREGIVSGKAVIAELARIAFAKTTDFLELSGRSVRLKSIDDMPPEFLGAIASIKETTCGVEIKFHNKIQALQLLAQHLGLLNGSGDDTESTGIQSFLAAASPSADDLKTLYEEGADDDEEKA